LQVGDVLKALEDANSCVRLNPGWCKGYNRKGACLLRLSLRDEAILSYEKVLELDASNAEAISALIKLRGSTARSAGSSQFLNTLLNYWNVFTTTTTRYSKDGYGYLKSFLDILMEYMRQCYYSVLTWWFSLGDQTKNFICIGIFVSMLYWLFFHKNDSYHRDYPDRSNLYGSHHSNSAGHTHSSYNRGGYGGSYHGPSYGGGYDSAYGDSYGGSYYSGGGMSWTTWILIMLGKIRLRRDAVVGL